MSRPFALRFVLLLLVLTFGAAIPASASEGGASMPWDDGLRALKENITGPLATTVVIIAMAGAGIMWAFSEHQTGFKQLSKVILGGSIAVFAVQAVTSLGVLGATI